MLLLSSPAFTKLANEISQNLKIPIVNFSINRFPNQELYIQTEKTVQNEICVVLASVSPPEHQLVSLLMLVSTLKKEGAKKVFLLLPYLAYSRHDKLELNKSHAIALLGKLFKAAGADKLITFDLHSPLSKLHLQIPTKSISTTKLFADLIIRNRLTDRIIIAPDKGRLAYCQHVAKLTHMKVIMLKKERQEKGIAHLQFNRTIDKKVIIVDDILDTGKTLISACQILKSIGVKDIVILITHGQFTGNLWKKLYTSGVKTIYCSDSIPQKKKLKGVKTVSILPLISI